MHFLFKVKQFLFSIIKVKKDEWETDDDDDCEEERSLKEEKKPNG